MTDRIESELLRGAAPLAVLQLLDRGEMYGYQMVEALAKDSNGALALGQSTLYPLLYNLEAKGLIRAEQREADSGRVRKYYRLTAQGRRYLAAGRKRWRALSDEMARLGLLGPVPMTASR
jgi:PadR family transcriptional regulator, regulatory protein PadR